MDAIAVSGLTKCFRAVRAVDDLSFVVGEGTITGFVGPNGAGKTTTLRAILGLTRPTSGTALVGGRPYAQLDRPPFVVGAALEADGFHPRRTARDHLRVVARPHRIPPGRVDEVLDQVDLTGAARRRVGGFSLGMRRRLALAGALLGNPPLLVLDEPANGLDPAGVHWLRGLLRARVEQGGTVLLSSHQLAELALSADHVVIIRNGRLITQGSLAGITGSQAAVVRVRTPQASVLYEVLAARGIAAQLREPDEVIATGASTQQVGQAVAAAGLAVYEMQAERPDLEHVFLQLTEQEVRRS
ncbi:ATP-binding cassette domain-containing protein [Geodermatophilus sp. SYSU D00698]